MYCFCNCAVAGMALMGAAVLTVKQVGVDRDGTVTDVQEEHLMGQREKILVRDFEHQNYVLTQQSTMVEFSNLHLSHVLAHAQLGCDFLQTGCGKTLRRVWRQQR